VQDRNAELADCSKQPAAQHKQVADYNKQPGGYNKQALEEADNNSR